MTLAQVHASLDRAERARPTVAPSKADQRTHLAMQRMVEDLRRPWFALFDALELSSDRAVHLVQLSVDGGFRRVQLQVEAPRMEDVMRFVGKLDEAEQPVARARLLAQEPAPTIAGRSPMTLARIGVGLRTEASAVPAVLEPSLRVACLGTLTAAGCGLDGGVR